MRVSRNVGVNAADGAPAAAAVRHATSEFVKTTGLVSGGMLQSIADSLVAWSSAIVGAAGDEDDTEARRVQSEQTCVFSSSCRGFHEWQHRRQFALVNSQSC